MAWARRRVAEWGADQGVRRLSEEESGVIVGVDVDGNVVDWLGLRRDVKPPEVAFMLLVLDGFPHVRGCGCPDCCCFCCCCC